MLKKIDYRLVVALQKDGRASYSGLAENLGINPSTAAKRVRHLLESKTIVVRAMPNPDKMGLVANAFIAIKAEPTKLDEVADKLVDNFYVNLVQTVLGRFDILIIVYFPTWEMLHTFINKDLSLMDGVLEIETHYIQEMRKRYEQVFIPASKDEPHFQLKENDWKLIKELVKDGRSNVKDLADRLGMNISIVSRRISALLDSNVIKIGAVPNPRKFGFSGNAYVSMTINAAKVEKICSTLYECKEIPLIMTMSQGSEMIIGVQTIDNEALYNTIKKTIAPIDGIFNTETFVWADIKKRYYGWFLEDLEEASKSKKSIHTASRRRKEIKRSSRIL